MSKRRLAPLPKIDTPPVPRNRRKNAGQLEAEKLFREFDIIFLLGPAGTGKTHAAVSLALSAEWVFITRPAIELEGEELGFLKGGPDEKLNPYMQPILDVLRTQVGRAEADKVFKSFEICPLAFIRGRTFNNGVAIFDEAQNATRSQRKTYLTRLGKEGKMIISGDPSQSDRHNGDAFIEEVNALVDAGIAGVVWFNQSMQERNPILKQVEDVYSKLLVS